MACKSYILYTEISIDVHDLFEASCLSETLTFLIKKDNRNF